jgi:membrane-associated protease RseP (regulator of RpoE activity)
MKKVVLLVVLLTNVFSITTYPDFSICYDRYYKFSGTIPVTKNYSISFKKPVKYLKYDPFLDIYLIKANNKKYVKLKESYKLGLWIASINEDSIFVGNYAKSNNGLNYAISSVSTPKGSIISDIFCNVHGIGAGNNRFITSKYIKYFLYNSGYGDVKFKIDRNFIITEKNPYNNKNFKIGDKILLINDKKLSYEKAVDTILMSKPNSYLKFTVLRNNKIFKLKAKVFQKGQVDNYLQGTGIVTDELLNIIQIKPNSLASKHYLSTSGKIKKINGHLVKTLDELNAIISNSKDVTITVEQNGMDFQLKYKLR